MLKFEYFITAPNQYQIHISPESYIIMYNVEITMKIMDKPVVNF